jgi:hypothetical protein
MPVLLMDITPRRVLLPEEQPEEHGRSVRKMEKGEQRNNQLLANKNIHQAYWFRNKAGQNQQGLKRSSAYGFYVVRGTVQDSTRNTFGPVRLSDDNYRLSDDNYRYGNSPRLPSFLPSRLPLEYGIATPITTCPQPTRRRVSLTHLIPRKLKLKHFYGADGKHSGHYKSGNSFNVDYFSRYGIWLCSLLQVSAPSRPNLSLALSLSPGRGLISNRPEVRSFRTGTIYEVCTGKWPTSK